MRGVWAFARILVLIYILAVLTSGADAQQHIARADPALAQISFAVTDAGSFSITSDVLFGRNARGPYNLSWKRINRFSESVSVDDRLMQRDSDYQIDYSTGAITFTSPIGSKSVIRIDYSYDASKAVQNRTSFNMPITLDIVKKQNAGLQFTGLYKQSDPNAKSAPDLVVYGLTGASTAREGEFSSMFLFNPVRSGENGQAEGSFGERSAMKLGGTTKTDKFQLRTSYLHVGEQFAGAKDYKLQRGLDAMDLAAVFTPSKALSLSSSFKRTENLSGAKKGQATAASEQKVVLSPEGAPKLTVTHAEVAKEKPGAADRETTTDKVQLEQKLGSSAMAVATHETVTTDIGGAESRLTTNQLAVSAKPAQNLAIQGKLTEKDSSELGKQTGIDLGVQAKPTEKLSVKAHVSRVERDDGAGGDEFTHALKVVSAPRPDVRLELGVTGRNAERPADESSRAVKLSTTAISKTSLHIHWAEKDSDVKGFEEFGGIRVETSPTSSVKLSGALTQRETPDARDLSKEARLEVQPFSHTTLGGAYKETESNGQVVARVSEVSALTTPSEFIKLSGAYKTREMLGQDDLNSVDLALQLDAGSILKLTGAYTTNPEDKKGVVQRVNSRSVGLNSDLGRLRLKGAYTLKDQYLAGKRSEMTEIGLDYRLSAHSLLTTGYSLDEYREASIIATSEYWLGYTHRIGARLNLYLGGKMTTYGRDQRLVPNESEYEAEARLGIKF